MDMGNDRAAALRELQGQYGSHQNAEQLISAAAAERDPTVTAASLKAIDGQATDELDLASIEPAQGGTVLSAAVRGNAIIYVAEDEQGRVYKGAQPLNDDFAAPKQSASALGARAQAQAQSEMRKLTIEKQAEIELKLQEMRTKLNEEASEELKQKAEESAEKAQKDAEDAAEKQKEQGAPTLRGEAPPTDPAQGGGAKQGKAPARS